jgi:hypothetical protein
MLSHRCENLKSSVLTLPRSHLSRPLRYELGWTSLLVIINLVVTWGFKYDSSSVVGLKTNKLILVPFFFFLK